MCDKKNVHNCQNYNADMKLQAGYEEGFLSRLLIKIDCLFYYVLKLEGW
jgi:hypothetical protein